MSFMGLLKGGLKQGFRHPQKIANLPITALKSREGQPWAQGVARNLGHGFFGDDAANAFEQKYLGDFEGGTRHPTSPGEVKAPAQGPLFPMAGGQSQGQKTTAPGGGADVDPEALQNLMNLWFSQQSQSQF